nr:hypothetical protein [Kamptonema sp. PCC 6506]
MGFYKPSQYVNREYFSMAKLPQETIATILNLQARLLAGIDEAKAAEFAIFEQYGETEATATVLEQLQNAAERLRNPYSRFYTLLLRISESQPLASSAMLNLLAQTIELAQADADAVEATIREAKMDFNLP